MQSQEGLNLRVNVTFCSLVGFKMAQHSLEEGLQKPNLGRIAQTLGEHCWRQYTVDIEGNRGYGKGKHRSQESPGQV